VCGVACFSALSGPLPSLSLPSLAYASLNNNQLSGALPQWIAPKLLQLNLANTPFNGAIPPGWWERMPQLQQIDASGCGLIGSIPDAAVPRTFSSFIMSDNELTGGLPANISATIYSVANNRLSGPVTMPADSQLRPISSLILAGNDFSCPIRLAHLTALQQLNLQSGGFAGCDFNDPAQVQLPESLTALDVR